MKKLLIILAVILLMSFHVSAEKFAIELYGGLSKLKSSEINQWADFKEASAVSNRTYTFQQLKALYGDYYTYSMTTSGKLDKISSGMPFGMNLRYWLGDRLSVSIGFRYMQKSVSSGVQSVADINDFYQGDRTETRTIEGYKNSVKLLAWIAGFKLDFIKQKNLTLSVTLNGGVLKGKFETDLKDKINYNYATGYQEERVYLDTSMSGTGNGYLLEAGLRAEYKMGAKLYLFGEGGYTIQNISSVSGDVVETSSRSNTDGTAFQNAYSYSGKWVVSKGSFSSGLPYRYYRPLRSGENKDKFSPDLSGVYVRVGIGFRF